MILGVAVSISNGATRRAGGARRLGSGCWAVQQLTIESTPCHLLGHDGQGSFWPALSYFHGYV